MNVNIDIKNLLFVIVGGVSVALINSYLSPSNNDYKNRVIAKHRKIQITSGESIINEMAYSAIVDSVKAVCEGKPKKSCGDYFKKTLKEIKSFEYFDGRKYTTIHELKLENNSDFIVSNIAIEHSFDFNGYLAFYKGDSYFHVLKPKKVFQIDEMRPGKVVEITFFSKAGYADSTKHISLTESGKKIPLLPIYGDHVNDNNGDSRHLKKT